MDRTTRIIAVDLGDELATPAASASVLSDAGYLYEIDLTTLGEEAELGDLYWPLRLVEDS